MNSPLQLLCSSFRRKPESIFLLFAKSHIKMDSGFRRNDE